MFKQTVNSFVISTEHQTLIIGADNEDDMHGWLYAFNPLLAGTIRLVNVFINYKHLKRFNYYSHSYQ